MCKCMCPRARMFPCVCACVYVPVRVSVCVHMSQVFSDTEEMTYTGQGLLEWPNHDTKLGTVKTYI